MLVSTSTVSCTDAYRASGALGRSVITRLLAPASSARSMACRSISEYRGKLNRITQSSLPISHMWSMTLTELSQVGITSGS